MLKKKTSANMTAMQLLYGLFIICICISALGGAVYFGYSLSELDKNLNPTAIQPSHYDDIYIYASNDSVCIKDVDIGTSTGASMQNAIWGGNSPLMRDVRGMRDIEYKEGWIVVAQLPGNHTIAHRIRGVYPDFVVTQGDTNDEYEIVQKSDIIGVIVAVIYT